MQFGPAMRLDAEVSGTVEDGGSHLEIGSCELIR
jgi:hypothetical protein